MHATGRSRILATTFLAASSAGLWAANSTLQTTADVGVIYVDGPACLSLPTDILLYNRLASGTNTSLNVLKLTACSTCSCALPLGEYRIIEAADGLKSDLGLVSDPDVQPFEYYFTLVQ